MNNRYLCKAKDKDDGRWYEGYYLLLHDTTYCCMPSDNAEETKRFEEKNTHHYIVFEQMTDWGIPNRHLGLRYCQKPSASVPDLRTRTES